MKPRLLGWSGSSFLSSVSDMARYGGRSRKRGRNSTSTRRRKRARIPTISKFKVSRTRTKTRTKRRRRGRVFGSGATSSLHITKSGRAMRFLKKVEYALATKYKYDALGALRFTSSTQQQGITFVDLFRTADLNAFTWPSTSGSNFLQAGVLHAQVKNQTNVNMTLWMYDIMLRNDTSASSQLNPGTDWQQGLIDEGGTGSDYLNPYTTPFKSKRFCERWLVKRVSKVFLSPGAEHTHTLKVKVNHKINKERFTTTGSTGTVGATDGVGRLTHAILFVGLGGLVNDSTTKTNVGYGAIAVDIAWTKKYTYMTGLDDVTAYSKANNLPVVTVAEFMDEFPTAVHNVVNA